MKMIDDCEKIPSFSARLGKLTSNESFQRQMDVIQKEIEVAHQKIKEKTVNTLRNISEDYQNKLLEKIAEEKLAKEALRYGDDRAVEQHRVRTGAYKSALDAIKG
jgi:hypothetical protein